MIAKKKDDLQQKLEAAHKIQDDKKYGGAVQEPTKAVKRGKNAPPHTKTNSP